MVINLSANNINPRYPEYLEYLHAHISNVNKAWDEVLCPYIESSNMINGYNFNIEDISRQIATHDKSKYTLTEFIPYLNHFYPCEGYEDISLEYDKAWLHHQQHNSHHWQNHVLIKDSGVTLPLDMNFNDICEMLCDWHSFSYVNSDSTAYNWYQNNKDKMLLSSNTCQILESMIDIFK